MDILVLEKRLRQLASVYTQDENEDEAPFPQLHHKIEIEALRMRHTMEANCNEAHMFEHYFSSCMEINPLGETTAIDAGELMRMLPLEKGYVGRNIDSGETRSSMGVFGRLPLEITDGIINHMDLESVTNLKVTSHTMRYLVANSRDYHFVFGQAPQAIRASLALGVGSFVNARQLRQFLLTYECAGCGNFGRYLYLPTWERACIRCINNSIRFHVIETSKAEEVFGINKEDIQQSGLEVVRTLPAHDRDKFWRIRIGSTRPRRWELVNWYSASQVGKGKYGSVENMFKKVAGIRRGALPMSTSITPYRGSCINTLSLRCAVEFPMVEMPTQEIQAFYCAGCADRHIFDTHRDFIKHFVDCEGAMSLVVEDLRGHTFDSEWKTSKEDDYSTLLAQKVARVFEPEPQYMRNIQETYFQHFHDMRQAELSEAMELVWRH